MDATRTYTPMQPKRIAELVEMLSCKKPAIVPLKNKPLPHTTGKKVKALTLAEMKVLIGATPKPMQQPDTSRQRHWNSSVKVDKTRTVTQNGQMKHSTVRKVLNFPPRSKPPGSSRTTMAAPVARKSYHPQGNANGHGMNVSGVYKIPETPVINKPVNRQVAKMKFNNISLKSNDDSFLLTEQEVNDFEEKSNALTEEPTLPREESVIVSLCEKLQKASVTNNVNDCQKLSELIEHEREMENDIKTFDTLITLINSMKEKQLKHLIYIRKLIKDKRKSTKENDDTVVVKENTDPIPNENNATNFIKVHRVTLMSPNYEATMATEEKGRPEQSPVSSRPTVITTKLPSYKIPKKNIGLRKRMLCNSINTISGGLTTPEKNTDQALCMYMQIKENMTFLNTPSIKRPTEVPDTPAVTSHNLRKQLDKLYNQS